MRVLKNDDAVFQKYPKLKSLANDGWTFMLDEYDDPHHGKPETDYYVRSPRMLPDSKISIRPWLDTIDDILTREARTMSIDFTQQSLEKIDEAIQSEFLAYFTEHRQSNTGKLTISVKVE